MNEFLKKNYDFFNYVFSCNYKFSLIELIIWKDKVKWGGYSYSFFDNNTSFFYQPELGLSFNENINWNDELIKMAEFNYLSFCMGESENTKFPLNKIKELEMNEMMTKIAVFSSCNNNEEIEFIADNYIEQNLIQIYSNNFLEINLTKLELELIIIEFSRNKRQVIPVLLNQSFYDKVLKIITNEIHDFSVAYFYNMILI